MTPLRLVRKIREPKVHAGRWWEFTTGCYALTESKAAALITPEPSKTAEEVARKVIIKYETGNELRSYPSEIERGIAMLIQESFDAYAKAKVEEAADRYCFNGCPHPIGPKNGECHQISGKCPSRAAILGREVGE